MKKTIGALMVAVSAVAFAASANASNYKPYVAADYRIFFAVLWFRPVWLSAARL